MPIFILRIYNLLNIYKKYRFWTIYFIGQSIWFVVFILQCIHCSGVIYQCAWQYQGENSYCKKKKQLLVEFVGYCLGLVLCLYVRSRNRKKICSILRKIIIMDCNDSSIPISSKLKVAQSVLILVYFFKQLENEFAFERG